MCSCSSLPNLITLTDCNGSWEYYENTLYQIFKNDFIDNIAHFMGKPIGIFTEKMYHDKEKTFWHIISDGEDENERIPNMRRCERIKWPYSYITEKPHETCNDIRMWKSLYKNKKYRYKIWCVNTGYIIILEERNKVFMLITAYVVGYHHVTEKLNKEYSISEKLI